jgi:transcriptional regulator with XRE-family HTH domain
MSRGGDLIREARRRAGLTQQEAAERVGTTQSAIARWERGGSAPSMDTTMRVLRALGFDLEYALVDYDDSDYAQARSMLRRKGPQARSDAMVKTVAALRRARADALASMRPRV